MQRLTLAALVEQVGASAGDAGRSLVAAVAQWLHARREHLALEAVASAGLVAVTLTLQVRGRVSLLVAAERSGLPGQWTWKVDEAEFPFVWLQLRDEPQADPYVVCTLDYACAGQRLHDPTGADGVALFAATVGDLAEVRAKMADGRVRTLAAGDVAWR
ncbi:MAG: hypothetical protein EXR79_17190 [Myxococcales bacterium]|nr:hypothetical protein [Myxococcales bacterium]